MAGTATSAKPTGIVLQRGRYTSCIKLFGILVRKFSVPCCGGMLQIAKNAREKSGINIPIKWIVLSVQGDVISENWV
ncbi:hypothetical protein SDC9_135818 [bioreactor metagenome]|uniref:Uncharacterized protein n=1 Tax=bioreactor metagenome TaxID=1076179 RepID=A0A645DGX2_9ZZZZ